MEANEIEPNEDDEEENENKRQNKKKITNLKYHAVN